MLNGVSYAKGLGTRAPSAVEFRPGGSCSGFTADIGVDDEVGTRGSIVFQVWGDGQKIYESGVMNGTTPTENVSLDISGIRSLRLETVAVDATSYDSGDWANARIICSTSSNQPPRASLTVSAISVRPGAPVTFNGTASWDPDGTIRSYLWDFGDGFGDSGPVVGHSYAQAGTFQVVLTVVDNGGASGTASTTITVTSAPLAAFSASPRATLPNIPIRFDASNSSDPGGHIVLYAWDFGDGMTSQGKVVTHAYVSRGVFAVRLLVRDDFNLTNETQIAVAVGNRPPAIASTSPNATTVLHAGEQGTFAVVATDPDGDPLTYSWTIDGVHVGTSSSSYGFVSMVPGTFAIRVLVSDGFAAVLFEWHVMIGDSTTKAPPATESSGTFASVGVIAMGLLATVVIHAARLRKSH
jgi:PKD repeat protein